MVEGVEGASINYLVGVTSYAAEEAFVQLLYQKETGKLKFYV